MQMDITVHITTPMIQRQERLEINLINEQQISKYPDRESSILFQKVMVHCSFQAAFLKHHSIASIIREQYKLHH